MPENSVPEAAWLTLSEGSSGCQAGSDVYYGVPNPSKCPQLTCTSSGIGYYVGTCDENDEPSASYNSFDTDYATCHPVAAPAGGGLYFDATKVYWGCAPSGYVAPFDKTYCVETHVAQAGSCPAKHFCVPKSAGTPCVMTYGDTPLDGWTGNAIYGKVQCAPADGDLLAPGSATVYEESGCSGAAVDFVDKSCMRTSSGGAPKSYRMIDPGSTKKVPGNIPDSSRRPLSCRP